MSFAGIPGYTLEDKVPIATRHLLPKQLKNHGLDDATMQVTEDALKALASKYTREAGVRDLERKVGSLCRAIAVRVAEAKTKSDNNLEPTGQKVFYE